MEEVLESSFALLFYVWKNHNDPCFPMPQKKQVAKELSP